MVPSKGFVLYCRWALSWLSSSYLLPYYEAFLLSVTICAGFASSGALVVFAYHLFLISPPNTLFLTKLLAKVLVFGGVSFTAGCVLRNTCARQRPLEVEEPRTLKVRKSSLVQFLAAACLGAVLVLLRLDKYPFPEPDEMHHLIVCRNLSEYGEYASGHPDTGFIRFDSYDSVGPTLLVPIALAFRLGGVELHTARLVVSIFFIGLCVVAAAFVRRWWNTTYFIIPVIFLIAALHSVYLARSVYGEVPALLFFLLALGFWDKSQSNQPHSKLFAVMAGIFVGMTLLTKLFFVIVVWPLFGALFYERCRVKNVSYYPSVAIMITSICVVFAWWLLQEVAGDKKNSADMMSMYQTFLVFGLDSTKVACRWFLAHPWLTISWLITLLASIPPVMTRTKGFPSRVALFYVVFFLFWWMFFTPGHISRYLWYSSATLGLMAGRVVTELAKRWLEARGRAVRRVVYMVLTGLICVPYGGQLVTQLRLVYVTDETRDLRDLARFIDQLPDSARVSTTFWPLERSLDFLTGRPISRLKAGVESARNYDVVVTTSENMPDFVSDKIPVAEFGKFRVWDMNR